MRPRYVLSTYQFPSASFAASGGPSYLYQYDCRFRHIFSDIEANRWLHVDNFTPGCRGGGRYNTTSCSPSLHLFH